MVLAAVPAQVAGGAAGLFSTAQQPGGALGVALFGTVFFGYLDGHSFEAALVHTAPYAMVYNAVLTQARNSSRSVIPSACAWVRVFARGRARNWATSASAHAAANEQRLELEYAAEPAVDVVH